MTGAWHEERFSVRSYEVDANERLTMRALAAYLQEAAGRDAARLGASVGQLREHGLAWVLHRLELELREPPRSGERVVVATWPRRFERLVALRDFEVRDQDGELRAVATSRWVVVDLGTRRLARLPQFVLDLPCPGRAPPLAGGGGALAGVDQSEADLERRFEVRRSDLDVVGHVNNTRYLGWVAESVPDQVYDTHVLRGLEIVFRREAVYGDTVVARSKRLAGGSVPGFGHELSADGRSLARAVSRWAEPPPPAASAPRRR